MNGFGIFYWKDGRMYRGEYKEDKKYNFGIYNGAEGKKYEGYWTDSVQKGLGKLTKKDCSFKIGYWEEALLANAIINETEMENKLLEIDNLIELTLNKVSMVVNTLRATFSPYINGQALDSFLY